MRTKIQIKRFLTYFITFLFALSFLTLSPSNNALAAVNLASGKLPTSSVAFTNLSRVTDGNRTTSSYADSYGNSGVNWIQINLGGSYNINNIKIWHYYGDSRKYHDVVVQISNTSDFSSPVTVYNNDTDGSAGQGTGSNSEYNETSAGLNIAFNGVNAQYVRFYSNGSTANAYNHYVEIEIYQGSTQITGNLASAKMPTSSAAFTGLSRVTDNIVDTNSYADSYTNSGIQWIQIDLGAAYNVNNIKLWHYFGDSRKYHDVVVQLSSYSDFSSPVTVYNNDTNNSANRGIGSDSEYTETSSGLDLDFSATNARYVRFYSNGSTANTYNHYVEIEIYASAATIHPASVSLSKTTTTLAAGGSETLTATVLPAEAANKIVTWSTSAEGIATVGASTGLVTGVAVGTATITATTADGGLTATCIVNIIPAVIHPTSVILNKTTDTIKIGATDTLTATVLPAEAANKNVTWSTSAAGIATVGASTGLVTGVTAGTATITATSVDGGLKATCIVTVEAVHPASISLNKTTDTIKIGATDTLTATVLPAEATNKNVTWSTSAAGIATVGSSTGLVTGVTAGTATITATSVDGGLKATCTVTVEAVHPASISLNKSTDTISVGTTDTLTATVLPAEAANKNVTWSTSAAGIATVGASNGLVTGVAAGTATITATTVDGGLKATCTVTVAAAASNVAAGKLPTSSIAFTSLARVTDGDKNTSNYADSYTNSGIQWIQIDLGANYNVGNIKLWHYFADGRKYHDVVVQLSNDSNFGTIAATVYNNDTNNSAGRGTGSNTEYAETSSGLNLAFNVVNARYVRFYSNGSNVNSYNHYVEVEIYGLPATVHPTSVSINKPTDTIAIGSTDTLTAIFVPSGTTNKNVTWSSSAPAVATVGSSTGVVTGVSVGSAIITATTEDGGLTATSNITIVDAVHPESVTLNKTTDTLIEAKLMTLTATVKPDNAANKSVAWSTSDSNVAAVSAKGVVTGINPGTANITATTSDGNLAATCIVTVTTGKITGDKTAYSKDNDNLENIYVTILTGNTATMTDINNWTADMTVKPSLNVRFDYGTAANDLTGVVSNATLGPRGQGTSFAALKSYKVKLSDTATKWKDQKTINLNKHPYDITKVRNKLAFDLMKMFPDTFSLRTQFCHLYIRDLNSSNKGYVDYGLFTQVEEPNKDFLESRGIEKTAYFYKAESFRFETYPDVIKNVSDPAYNKTEFEKILGIEGTEEHSRLIAMLKDVNDETQDINAVIDKWFDRDNYVTWMAMNLLIGNTDTVDSNFFLLSPVDQEKWYFVPWDYDYSLGSINAPNADNSWMAPYMMDGISLYWGISMHRRFLEDPDNLAAVTAKLEELSTIATKAVVTDKVSKYYASTHTIVNRLPDTKVRDGSLQVYENEIKRLSNVLDDAKQAYYDGFAKPMPVVTKGVQISGGQATFTWEQAYKFDNDTLHYDFTLSSDPDFNNIIDESTGMLGTSVVVNSLPAGTYYWKVEVYDPSGNRTISVDNYYDVAADAYYFGVRQLVVK